MYIHTVKPGESLRYVAKNYAVSAEKLREMNGLSDPDRLTGGMALIIPTGAEPKRSIREFYAVAYPDISADSLDYALPCLTALCPFGRSVNSDGTLSAIDDAQMVERADSSGAAPFLTVANLESGGFSSKQAHEVFTDEKIKNTLFDSIFAVLQSERFRGVNVYFQYIYPFDRKNFGAFMGELSKRLHRQGYYLMCSTAPDEIASHLDCCDRIAVLTYDWGSRFSSPGAVSPAYEMERALSRAVSVLPSEKILMGFSNYAYNWIMPWKQGDEARYMSNAAAQELAVSAVARVKYDVASQCAYFNYTDAVGVHRQVWYEDARSIRARLALVRKYGLAGISCWTIDRLWKPVYALFSSMYERK